MRLIYVLGPAHGKVEEFTPAWGESTIPPQVIKQRFSNDIELGELFVKYELVHLDESEAYYILEQTTKGELVKRLMELTE